MFGKLWSGLVKTLTENLLEVIFAVIFVALAFIVRSWAVPVLVTALIWAAAFFFVMRVLGHIIAKAGFKAFSGNYTTRDIMVMAALIAIGGVVKGYWGQVRMISEALGGFYTGVFVAWMFYLWGILACYYVRKPWCGTISMVLGGVVEIMVGNPFGIPVLLFNFWEGLAPDLVYGAYGYRKHNVWMSIGSGVLASAFGLVYGWFYFGFAKMPPVTFVVYVLLALAAGVVAGVIAYLVILALNKVGVKPPASTTVEAI